jgi:hypothetical protein
MFYPDSTLSVNAFAYIYGHGQPLASVDAVNMMVVASTSKVRVIIDQVGLAGARYDLSTSNTITADTWNAVAVSYNGAGTLTVHLNGTSTSQVGSSIPTISPTGGARIGYATHGGSRQFNGRLCHVAKFDRALTNNEVPQYTATLFSPEVAQNSKIWHVEMWNSTFCYDLQNNISTTLVSMSFGLHAPAAYPSMIATSLDDGGEQVSFARKVMYVGA